MSISGNSTGRHRRKSWIRAARGNGTPRDGGAERAVGFDVTDAPSQVARLWMVTKAPPGPKPAAPSSDSAPSVAADMCGDAEGDA